VGLEPGLFGGVVLTGDGRVVELGAVGFNGEVAVRPAEVGAGGNAVEDAPPIRVCIDIDASWWALGGRIKVGPKRSPVHTVEQAVTLAREIERRPQIELDGLMAYEGQIAGVGNEVPGRPLMSLAIRAMQKLSIRELRPRRAEIAARIGELAPLEFVNGGGTGSAELTASEPAVTEVAAGSGLYAPTLFDHYTRFTPAPAAYFALPVVRRPSPRHATVLGGGWIASGQAGSDRLPTPVWPPTPAV